MKKAIIGQVVERPLHAADVTKKIPVASLL